MSKNNELRTNNRAEMEMKRLFGDPKYSRQAWKAVGQAILANPCQLPTTKLDKDGNLSFDSKLDGYSYAKLKEDIVKIGKQEDREPTELEMIMYNQILRARFDTSAAVFVRDTLGAKPVDESKMEASINNPFESLTDDELDALAKYRQAKLEADGQTAALPDADPAD